ncbi:hypothetical protein CLV80_103306 [Yoonia maritima]|uniref:Uncharacterized protein n=1 Tax=Yoonia maritima TaxID=1435347 RepID=A0A2T0W1Y8_9RHOB|nr:hypothetical protein CLV80_103306 [Yoonia maritima]
MSTHRLSFQKYTSPTLSPTFSEPRRPVPSNSLQANDYSAVIVIKDQALPIVDDGKIIVGPRERTVVHADRFRGMSYVDVVDHLVRLRNASPLIVINPV